MARDSLEQGTIVVVVAPDRGASALGRLIAGLPRDFPSPIAIAYAGGGQHAIGIEELRDRSDVKIEQLDGEPRIMEAGTAYFAPPGHDLSIDESTVLAVAADGERRALDRLLSSAAKSAGEGVIAVVLGGGDYDVASGLRDVKERGGTVVLEEAGPLEKSGLHAAIAINHIDLAASAEALPALLCSLVSNDGAGADVRDPEVLRAFLSQLRSRIGIDFRQYKTATIARRLGRLMAAARCESLAEYLRFLNSDPDAYGQLGSAFLIKVTGFFRDAELFKYIGENVLPEIVARAKEQRSEVRIWSAGCATGEEAYSIAIVLAELLDGELDDVPVRIFATDLDGDAIAYARRGLYPASALSALEPAIVERYFTKIDGAYQVKKRIRNLTVFGEYNLGQRAPFPRIDLVLCRNVLIYFTKELQQRTLQLFAFSLRPGGYLLLGKSETANPLPQYFTPVQPLLKVFRRQGEGLLIPAPAFADGAALPERPSVRRSALRSTLPKRSVEVPIRSPLNARIGAFLFDSPVGIVIVDRNYDIRALNQAARSLLGIHGQGIGDDLVHLITSRTSGQLRASLDAAFRSEMPTGDEEIEVEDAGLGEVRTLLVSCYPDRSKANDGRVEDVIVLVYDVTRSAVHRRKIEQENDESRNRIDRLTAQNAALLERQRNLIEANNELTAANNELRNSNEHLLIAAEEAEASAEEVETLNEEMQATSEELETLNEELQATVEELNTTNEELAARGAELEGAGIEMQQRLDAAELSFGLLRASIDKIDGMVAVLDQRKLVVAVSSAYRDFQPRSPVRLPSVGEPWADVDGVLHVDGNTGGRFSVSVVASRPGHVVTIRRLASS